jgi:hypothetical protein
MWLALDSDFDIEASIRLNPALLCMDKHLGDCLDVSETSEHAETAMRGADLIEVRLRNCWHRGNEGMLSDIIDQNIKKESIHWGSVLSDIALSGRIAGHDKTLSDLFGHGSPLQFDSTEGSFELDRLQALLTYSANIGHLDPSILARAADIVGRLELLHKADADPETYVRALWVVWTSGVPLDSFPEEIKLLPATLSLGSWNLYPGLVAAVCRLAHECELDDWSASDGFRFAMQDDVQALLPDATRSYFSRWGV